MFTVVLALIPIQTFTNVCIRVRLNVYVFVNAAPLVVMVLMLALRFV